jgi:hypothetical protein
MWRLFMLEDGEELDGEELGMGLIVSGRQGGVLMAVIAAPGVVAR